MKKKKTVLNKIQCECPFLIKALSKLETYGNF